MLFVRQLSGQLGAHDGNDARKGIGQIVDSIQRDSDGMCDQTDGCLECSKKHINQNADNACSDNSRLTGILIFNRDITHIDHLQKYDEAGKNRGSNRYFTNA